jgi:hypothetical protein
VFYYSTENTEGKNTAKYLERQASELYFSQMSNQHNRSFVLIPAKMLASVPLIDYRAATSLPWAERCYFTRYQYTITEEALSADAPQMICTHTKTQARIMHQSVPNHS